MFQPTTTIQKIKPRFLVLALFFIAILFRFMLRNNTTIDHFVYTNHWIEFIRLNGIDSLRYRFTDYTPMYTYLMMISTKLFYNQSNIIIIKMISFFFDGICAYFVYKIVALKYPHTSQPWFAAIAVLLLPTALLNSGYWGQSDSIYTSGLLGFLYFSLKKKSFMAMFMFSLAFAMKLQSIFLIPFIIILLIREIIPLRYIFIVPATYIVTIIPMWIFGRPLTDLLTIYLSQMDSFPQLSLNFPNFYQWFPYSNYTVMYPIGFLLTFFVGVMFIWDSVTRIETLDPGVYIGLAFLSLVIMPYFLPKMHDRYFYPADMVAILLVFYIPAYRFVLIGMGTASFMAYIPFVTQRLIDLRLYAIMVLGIIIITWYGLIRNNKTPDSSQVSARQP